MIVIPDEEQPSTSGTQNEPAVYSQVEEDLAGVQPGQFPGLTPDEWGELLGVFSGSLEEEPTVLHCFEQLGESGGEEDTD